MVKVIDGVYVTDFKKTSNISMTTQHISNYTGKFVCEGNPLNGKMFIEQHITAVSGIGNFGKTRVTVSLLSEPAKHFASIKGLVNAYNNELKTK